MVSKKAAVAVACGALAVPGVAQATHTTGKMGAPGQVCKPLKQEQKTLLKAFRAKDPAPSKQEVRTFRELQRAAYKGCIKQAAKARSEDKQGETETPTVQKVSSKGAPGQVCKKLRVVRKAQLKEFKSQTPAPTKQAVREFKQTQRAAYKGCILEAAKARSESNEQNSQEKSKGKAKGKPQA